MTDCDLNKLKLIAQGGEADIYDAGNDKIIRVLRRQNANKHETPKKLFQLLEKYHINVPHIYEFTEIDGRPAEVMQKINGKSMLDQMQKSPLGIHKIVKKLARMQVEVSEVRLNDEVYSIRGRVDFFASQPPVMDKRLNDFSIKMFEELPCDNQLCHGDFHPGNILVQDSCFYIIDWSGAYRGSYLSDVAHTYLLLKVVPQIPGQSRMQHLILSFSGKLIARSYLKEIYKMKCFDRAAFSKWTVVMSFLRAYYGLPSERDGRINYITNCFKLYEKGVDAALWYKKI